MAGSYYNTGWNNLSSGGGGNMAGGYHFVDMNNTYGGAYGRSGSQLNSGGPNSGANGGWGVNSSSGNPGINGLISQQLADNAWARQNNLAEWQGAKNTLMAVPGQYNNDPMRQGARNLAQYLLQNPEAINDRTQQLAINRGSNLINAAGNARLNSMMGDAAASGQLGSSNLQAGYDQIERQRMGQLMGMGSDLEIKRAERRNQDYQTAIGIGSQLAGQDHGVNMGVASTLIQNLPQFRADDLSGLIATMGNMQGGGQYSGQGPGSGAGGGASMYTNNAPTGRYQQPPMQNQLQGGFAGNWTAPQADGPSVSQFGTYNNNFNPNWQQQGGGQLGFTGGSAGANRSYGGNTFGNIPYPNQGSRPTQASGQPVQNAPYMGGNASNAYGIGGASSTPQLNANGMTAANQAISDQNHATNNYNYSMPTTQNQYGAGGTVAPNAPQGNYLGHGITIY